MTSTTMRRRRSGHSSLRRHSDMHRANQSRKRSLLRSKRSSVLRNSHRSGDHRSVRAGRLAIHNAGRKKFAD